MNISKIVAGLLTLADSIAPLLQGTPAAAIVQVGKTVIDMIDDVQDILDGEDAVALAEKRAELEPKVLAHLDQTIESLG